MFSSLKQYIASFLLVVLACSCLGLSFGMIGHGFMQMDGGEHESKTMHDCCGIADTGETEGTAATGIDHHTPTVATLSFLDLLIALLAVFVAIALPGPVQRVVISRYQLYTKMWLERWSYFALYFKQLFSRGILHPKTW